MEKDVDEGKNSLEDSILTNLIINDNLDDSNLLLTSSISDEFIAEKKNEHEIISNNDAISTENASENIAEEIKTTKEEEDDDFDEKTFRTPLDVYNNLNDLIEVNKQQQQNNTRLSYEETK